MEKAACYLRVSTERQTVENQRAAVEQLARARGYDPVWYEEQESATKHRPELDRMLADVRRGKVAAVICWALNRLHRNMVATAALVVECDRLRVRVLSVSETWLDTDSPARPLLVAVFGWVAEEELRQLKDRTRAGIRRAREKGTKSGKAIGRPRASPIMLSAAADAVASGRSIRKAATIAGVKESTLRRFLKAREETQP